MRKKEVNASESNHVVLNPQGVHPNICSTTLNDTFVTAHTSTSDTHIANHLIIPKPIFKRLLTLFGGGVGCSLVGIAVYASTGDLVTMILSAILGVSFVTKGFVLRSKIRKGLVFDVSGVCIGIAPKFFGRYRRIELLDVDTGGSAYFILPKKITFKIGHVYICYFDIPINTSASVIAESGKGCGNSNDIIYGDDDYWGKSDPNSHSDTNNGISSATNNNGYGSNSPKSRFFNDGMDLPTNGFLGFEDFGVYQEKPLTSSLTATEAVTASDKSPHDQDVVEDK